MKIFNRCLVAFTLCFLSSSLMYADHDPLVKRMLKYTLKPQDAFHFCREGNLNGLMLYHNQGGNMNAIEKGKSLLHVAVESKQAELVNFLVHVVDDSLLDSTDSSGKSALDLAYKYYNKEIIKILSSLGIIRFALTSPLSSSWE